MQTGTIFDIQRFSLTNGSGIRTTFFLKGCPLRCKWCHNPESLAFKPLLVLDREVCQHCGICMNVCEQKVHQVSEMTHTINHSDCQLEGNCVLHCPNEALKIEGKSYNSDALVAEALKDKSYYLSSGGGVTFSGGEPMSQFAFLLESCQKLKQENIHICLDTSGHASKKKFEEILPFIDLIHYDIKHLDPFKHKALTGVSNRQIQENLKWLGTQNVPIILRCPLIPNINDRPEMLQAIGKLANELDAVERIDLLPYHSMGVKKAKNIEATQIEYFEEPSDHLKKEWEICVKNSTHKKVELS